MNERRNPLEEAAAKEIFNSEALNWQLKLHNAAESIVFYQDMCDELEKAFKEEPRLAALLRSTKNSLVSWQQRIEGIYSNLALDKKVAEGVRKNLENVKRGQEIPEVAVLDAYDIIFQKIAANWVELKDLKARLEASRKEGSEIKLTKDEEAVFLEKLKEMSTLGIYLDSVLEDLRYKVTEEQRKGKKENIN